MYLVRVTTITLFRLQIDLLVVYRTFTSVSEKHIVPEYKDSI